MQRWAAGARVAMKRSMSEVTSIRGPRQERQRLVDEGLGPMGPEQRAGVDVREWFEQRADVSLRQRPEMALVPRKAGKTTGSALWPNTYAST
jgi:hypothetical protein